MIELRKVDGRWTGPAPVTDEEAETAAAALQDMMNQVQAQTGSPIDTIKIGSSAWKGITKTERNDG